MFLRVQGVVLEATKGEEENEYKIISTTARLPSKLHFMNPHDYLNYR